MKPNIFEIATKELSQDAFITWLLMWADDSCQKIDKDLSDCGKAFVSMLIKKQNPSFSESIKKVEAGRQWENIDVWAEVNDKYLIIIEDKTNTGQHSNQLERYKEIAENWCGENEKEPPICIYLKTGNESLMNLENIKSKGYAIFDRQDFINLFSNYEQVNNHIFIDFYERIKNITEKANEFKTKKINEWEYNDWEGFYKEIETKVENEGWFYVSNPNGGFLCFLLNWGAIYAQLEQDKFCFKIAVEELPEGKTKGQYRDEFYHLLMEKAKQKGYDEINKPKRFGNGNYMTIAVVEQKDWLGESILDVNKAAENIKKYQSFLSEFIKEHL